MALESGTYINSLNASNPAATDGIAQADDHMRLIKSTVKASFPGVTGAVTSTHTELNALDGFTGVVADLNYAKDLRATGVTAAELDKLDGFTGTADDLNYAKDLRATGVTATEFDTLDGVLSALQTQIDAIPKLVKTVNANGGARFPNVGATENLDHRVGGVSRLPKFLVAYAVADSANNGYSQQDRVFIGGSDTQYNAQSGITIGFDLVNITYRIGTNAAGFTIMSKTNGNSINIANDFNWLLKFDVYA